MNIELQTEPNFIKKLQALNRRMDPAHPEKEHVQTYLKKELAGIKEETALIHQIEVPSRNRFYYFTQSSASQL